MQTIVNIFIILHFYLVVRCCVGNLFPRNRLDQWTRLKHVIIVVVVPFIGYYWAVNREDK